MINVRTARLLADYKQWANQRLFDNLAQLPPAEVYKQRAGIFKNMMGTLNVLQAVRELGVGRLVHTSTSEVYGSAQTIPMTEDHPLVGQSPYSASKIGGDKLASFKCNGNLCQSCGAKIAIHGLKTEWNSKEEMR